MRLQRHRLILYQQNSVNCTVHFGVVGDLRVLAPHDLAARGDEAQLGHVHLDDCALGDDTQLQVNSDVSFSKGSE